MRPLESSSAQRRHVVTVSVGGTIENGSLSLTLDGAALSGHLAVPLGDLAPGVLSLTTPFTLRRRGVEMKLLAGKPSPAPDPSLRKALADAHRWAQALQSGTAIHEIAHAAGHHEAHIRTRTPLAFLSPRIQRAIHDGTQPADLTLERLVRQNLPLVWESQERLCRF